MHGFWTLTTYDDRAGLVDNPVDRYSIGDWNGLALDRDGSLPIRIQHSRPADTLVELAARPARPVQPPAAAVLAAGRGARPEVGSAAG